MNTHILTDTFTVLREIVCVRGYALLEKNTVDGMLALKKMMRHRVTHTIHSKHLRNHSIISVLCGTLLFTFIVAEFTSTSSNNKNGHIIFDSDRPNNIQHFQTANALLAALPLFQPECVIYTYACKRRCYFLFTFLLQQQQNTCATIKILFL